MPKTPRLIEELPSDNLFRMKLVDLSINIGKRLSEEALGKLSISERKKPAENPRTKGKTSTLDVVGDGILVNELQKFVNEYKIPISLMTGGDKIQEDVLVSTSGHSLDRIVLSADVFDGTTNAMKDGSPWVSSLFGYTWPTSDSLTQLKFGDFEVGVVYVASGTSAGTVKTGNAFYAHIGGLKAFLRDSDGKEFPLTTSTETKPGNWSFVVDTMAARATYPPGPERETKGNARRIKFLQSLVPLIGGTINDTSRLFGAGLEQMAMLSPSAEKVDTTLSFYSGNPRFDAFVAAYQFKDNIAGPKTILKGAGASCVVFAGPQKGIDIDEVPLQPHTHYLAAGNEEVKKFVLDSLKDYQPD